MIYSVFGGPLNLTQLDWVCHIGTLMPCIEAVA